MRQLPWLAFFLAGCSGDPTVPEKLERDPLVVCPGAYKTTAPAAGQNAGFDSAGQARSFYLALPDLTAFPGPRPLFVYFHGTNGSGSEVYRVGDQRLLSRGFVVLAPDGNNNGRNWPTWDASRIVTDPDLPNADLSLTDDVIDCVAAHYPVDKKRIFIAGISAGGMMTNFVANRRSDRIAAAVPCSGVFSLTRSMDKLDPFAALVVWGGDNDMWGGSTTLGKSIANFNFAEQAALASAYYEAQPGLEQFYCRGDDLGHGRVQGLVDWIADFLLAHPKGLAKNPSYQPGQPDPSSRYTCSPNVATFTGPPQVVCPATTPGDCHAYCDYIASCVVENATVQAVAAPELPTLGFAGDDFTDCTGCITNCEADVTSGRETAVLACLATAEQTACGAGVEGIMPIQDAVNRCCDQQTDSRLCQRICGALNKISVAARFFPTCQQFL